jgi:hypothetical protein
MNFHGSSVKWRPVVVTEKVGGAGGTVLRREWDVLFINNQPTDMRLQCIEFLDGDRVTRTLRFDKKGRIVRDSTIEGQWLAPPAIETLMRADQASRSSNK